MADGRALGGDWAESVSLDGMTAELAWLGIGHTDAHKCFGVAADGQTEEVVWQSACVGDRDPAARLQRLAPLSAVSNSTDPRRLGKAQHQIAAGDLRMWQKSGANLFRVQAECKLEQIGDAVMVEIIEIGPIATIGGATEIGLTPGFQG